MTKPKDYVPIDKRRRPCRLPDCGRYIRFRRAKGRPKAYCSEACREVAKRARLVELNAAFGRGSLTSRRNRQEAVMRARGWLSVAFVAKRLGRSRSAVYQWVHTGRVQAVQVAATWYVVRASLDAVLGEAAKVLDEARP